MKRKWIKVLLGLAVTACVLVGGCMGLEQLEQPANGDAELEAVNRDNESEDSRQGLGNSEQENQESSIKEEEEGTTETQEPVITKVTISATGDCTLGSTQTHGYEGSFHEYYDKNGEEYFFADVREIFAEDDFTLVNLECVLTESTDRVEKTWNLKGRSEYTGIMTSSSIEGCSLGNNHTLDYGPTSLTDTISAVEQAGIVYGYNDQVGMYTTSQGIKIGIVSASLLSGNEKYANYIRDGITELKAQGADMIMAACHWGIEGDHYSNQYQQDMAHQIIDWGADVVIGNHPHVLQGIELYNGKIICYSLGNFCFGGNRNPSDKNTMIYQQTFTFVDGQLQEQVDARVIPCRISSIDSRNDFQPTIAEGERKATILANLNEYSKPYGALSFEEDGTIVIGE